MRRESGHEGAELDPPPARLGGQNGTPVTVDSTNFFRTARMQDGGRVLSGVLHSVAVRGRDVAGAAARQTATVEEEAEEEEGSGYHGPRYACPWDLELEQGRRRGLQVVAEADV